MTQDWTGNLQSTHVNLGSRNFAVKERQNEDFYATHPSALEALLTVEVFDKNIPIWECACGAGHLSEVLIQKGYKVESSDLYDRGYGKCDVDFLDIGNTFWNGNIITNPPFKYSTLFIEKALEIIEENNKAAFLLPTRYLEGVARGKIFKKYPPLIVYVPSRRFKCALGGKFGKMNGNALSFAWFIWWKGFNGITSLKWL